MARPVKTSALICAALSLTLVAPAAQAATLSSSPVTVATDAPVSAEPAELQDARKKALLRVASKRKSLYGWELGLKNSLEPANVKSALQRSVRATYVKQFLALIASDHTRLTSARNAIVAAKSVADVQTAENKIMAIGYGYANQSASADRAEVLVLAIQQQRTANKALAAAVVTYQKRGMNATQVSALQAALRADALALVEGDKAVFNSNGLIFVSNFTYVHLQKIRVAHSSATAKVHASKKAHESVKAQLRAFDAVKR